MTIKLEELTDYPEMLDFWNMIADEIDSRKNSSGWRNFPAILILLGHAARGMDTQPGDKERFMKLAGISYDLTQSISDGSIDEALSQIKEVTH